MLKINWSNSSIKKAFFIYGVVWSISLTITFCEIRFLYIMLERLAWLIKPLFLTPYEIFLPNRKVNDETNVSWWYFKFWRYLWNTQSKICIKYKSHFCVNCQKCLNFFISITFLSAHFTFTVSCFVFKWIYMLFQFQHVIDTTRKVSAVYNMIWNWRTIPS